MKRYLTIFLSSLIFLFGISLPAFADLTTPIPGLYNTGVDDSSSVLPIGANDNHYVLSSSPDGFAGTSKVVPYPSQWVNPPGSSYWIGPQSHGSDAYTTDPAGLYSYKLTFNLTGLNSATASISGKFTSDNAASLYLNNTFIATTILSGDCDNSAYCILTSFTIATGSNFNSGSNTLEFRVTNNDGNTGNPSGLLVSDLQGFASSVPIPGAVWLLGTGLVGLVGVRRKFKK